MKFCLTKNRAQIWILVLVSFVSARGAIEKLSEEKSSGVYVGVEGGVSISNHVLLAPDWTEKDCNLLQIWAPTGSDSFDTYLGTAKCIGFKIGYQINPIISCDVTYGYRGKFCSQRGYSPNMIASLSFLLGDIFTFKNISIQTVLFNINLSPNIPWGGFVPYISGGIGVASNRIGCMERCNLNYSTEYPLLYDLILYGRRTTCFSWQAGIGAYYNFHNHWRFGMAYRFLDAGELTTGNYCTDTVSKASGSAMRFIAKHATFSELLVSLTYCF